MQRGIVKGCVISFCYTGTGLAVRLSNSRRCRSGKVRGSTLEASFLRRCKLGIVEVSGLSVGGGFRKIYVFVSGRMGRSLDRLHR